MFASVKYIVFSILFFLSIQLHAGDTITGNWRGTIIGHTDNKDYFIRATIDSVKKDQFTIRMKIFSGDYIGEFLLHTTRRLENRLYIDTFTRVNEFPYSIPYINECFTGYFQVKKGKITELDLYRNAIYRHVEDFKNKDTAGNYIPDFECFTSVELHPTRRSP